MCRCRMSNKQTKGPKRYFLYVEILLLEDYIRLNVCDQPLLRPMLGSRAGSFPAKGFDSNLTAVVLPLFLRVSQNPLPFGVGWHVIHASEHTRERHPVAFFLIEVKAVLRTGPLKGKTYFLGAPTAA